MFRVTRWLAVFAAVMALVAVADSPAFAIFRQLQTTLSGPDLDGQVPEGEAKVDQSELPRVAGQERYG